MSLNLEEFKKVLEENENVVIKFSAEWCGPCKALKPILDDLSTQYCDKVKFVEIDVENSDELTSEYKVRNVPTILYIKNGEVKDKSVGTVNKQVLTDKITNLINN
jgi:thioredoxin 1